MKSAQSFRVWLFLVAFGIGWLLVARPLYLMVEAILNFNNITWLGAYLLSILGLHSIVQSGYMLIGKRYSWAYSVPAIATALMLTWLFVGYISHEPVSLNRQVPENLYQFYAISLIHLFWSAYATIYTYCILQTISGSKWRAVLFVTTTMLMNIWVILDLIYIASQATNFQFSLFPKISAILLSMAALSTLFTFTKTEYYEKLFNRLKDFYFKLAIHHLTWLIDTLEYSTPISANLPVQLKTIRPGLFVISQITLVADWVYLVEANLISTPRRDLFNLLKSMPSDLNSAIVYCVFVSFTYRLRIPIFSP